MAPFSTVIFNLICLLQVSRVRDRVSGKPTDATWLWFVLMDETLGQKSSIRPVVLIALQQWMTKRRRARGKECGEQGEN